MTVLSPVSRRAVVILGAALFAAAVYVYALPARPVLLSLALAALAFYRTSGALLVLAAFGPIAGTLQGLLQLPHDGNRLFESAVVVVCGAALLRAIARGIAIRPTLFEWAALALALVAVVSCLVQIPVAMLRVGQTEPAAGAALLLRQFFGDRSPAFAAVWQTLVLVSGVALATVTARAAQSSEVRASLVRMILLGGVAAAALNVQRLVEVALRNPPFGEGLFRALQTFRFNTQFGDVNAAGSYFVLIAILAVARALMAGVTTRRGLCWIAALPVVGVALWVSGSRVALLAAVLGSAASIALHTRAIVVGRMGWRRAAFVSTGLAVLFVAALALFPVQRHGTFGYSVFTRVELLKTGARMWRDHPWTGVGISQFYARFPDYASPELLAAFLSATGTHITHENAHNQFVQYLAELGLYGLAAVLVVVFLAVWPANRPDDAERRATTIALLGFAITCVAGHPLLIPIVAYTFWLTVGVAASDGPPAPARASWVARYGVVLSAFLLLATLPARARVDRQTADLDGVSLGLSGWNRDEAGTRFRWSGRRSTLFVSSGATGLRLPLKSPDGAARTVAVLLEGRPAAGVAVPPGLWVDLNLPLPRSPSGPRYFRVDLDVRQEVLPTDEGSSTLLMVGRQVDIRPVP